MFGCQPRDNGQGTGQLAHLWLPFAAHEVVHIRAAPFIPKNLEAVACPFIQPLCPTLAATFFQPASHFGELEQPPRPQGRQE